MENDLRKSYLKVLLPILVVLLIIGVVIFYFALDMNTKLKRYKPQNPDLKFVTYIEDTNNGVKKHFFYKDSYYPLCEYKSNVNLDDYFDFVIENNEAYISKYKGKSDTVYLPTAYKNYNVVGVKSGAFDEESFVRNIYGNENILRLEDRFIENDFEFTYFHNFPNLEYLGYGSYNIGYFMLNNNLKQAHSLNLLNVNIMKRLYIGDNLELLSPDEEEINFFLPRIDYFSNLYPINITLSKKNSRYTLVKGSLLSSDLKTLYYLKDDSNQKAIENVTKIASFAITCLSNKEYKFEHRIEEIESFAIGISNTINFLNGVDKINPYIFCSNYGNLNINIEGSVDEICDNAFSLYEEKQGGEVHLPKSINKYGVQGGPYLPTIIID